MSTNGDSLVHSNGNSTKKIGGVTGKGFLPGKSGNPGGRSKRKPLTEALEQIFDRKICLQAAKALAKRAAKGSLSHFQEAADRIEGKVGSDDEKANVSFHVTIDIPFPQKDE